MDTYARFDELLQARNLSIFQFSKDSGIPYSTFANSRHRGTQLSVDTIELICQALGISLAAFFMTEEETNLYCK